MNDIASEEFPFSHFTEIEKTVSKRNLCNRCCRPLRVCLCSAFPKEAFPISTNVFILQHPREQDFRQLTTVPLLQECIPKDKCKVYRGKRFPAHKFPEVHDVLDRPNTILLFPSKDAISIEEYLVDNELADINLFVVDGTWKEAKGIYFNFPKLHHLKKVMLSGKWKSQFVIRTQPNNDSVSTLEAVAIAIAQFEKTPDLIEVARKPLKYMCDIQLQHGALVHDSKEELAARGIKYRFFESNCKKKELPSKS
ncbi:tRNA-uridine aminocarboxypropyltransferase 2 isoform X1 [Hydra vulgaris]|nr:tRNA-uridine aminocarboxypropyltransferase 2-like [Hydra vulgaris]